MTDQQQIPPTEEAKKWAADFIDRHLQNSRDVRQRIWTNLRDKMMTLSAGTIALSLLALQISNTPSSTELIRAAWVFLLASLGFGFVSMLVDYIAAGRVEQSIEAHHKLNQGVVTDETMQEAIRLHEWTIKWGPKTTVVVDGSLYVGLASYAVGIVLITAFAWGNV